MQILKPTLSMPLGPWYPKSVTGWHEHVKWRNWLHNSDALCQIASREGIPPEATGVAITFRSWLPKIHPVLLFEENKERRGEPSSVRIRNRGIGRVFEVPRGLIYQAYLHNSPLGGSLPILVHHRSGDSGHYPRRVTSLENLRYKIVTKVNLVEFWFWWEVDW